MAQPKLALVAAFVVFSTGAIWYIASRRGGEQAATKPEAAADKGAKDDTITDEAERLAYVKSSIGIEDLAIGPKPKPGDAGIVPGLLEVSGKVLNKGPRGIRTVNLVVNLQDNDEKVIGTYFEDLLHGQRLDANDSRAFRFEVPEKKEFQGRFLHEIR
jgi:hypothetical protein